MERGAWMAAMVTTITVITERQNLNESLLFEFKSKLLQ